MTRPTSPELGFTVSADLIRGLIECAVQCGVARSRLTDFIDWNASAYPLAKPPARYPGSHIIKLWDRILRETGDPIIGFRMALVAEAKTFGALGQILPRCATVFEAYRQTARYAALASQGASITVARDAEVLKVSLVMRPLPPGDIARAIRLWGLTNLCLVPRHLANAEVRPRAVNCTSPAPGPSDIRAVKEHFPFRFGGSEDQIVFDSSVGELKIPSADADLQSLLVETMDRHLAALGPAASFEQGVLTVLRGMMNGNMPTLASFSRRSGMSQRTLQRRLAESNTSFQRLLRRVLHEASDELLARNDLSHGEIAFLLGYSEESTFSRAYKAWTGHPPSRAHPRHSGRDHVP
jgi:AraC-like DNA-binding protein